MATFFFAATSRAPRAAAGAVALLLAATLQPGCGSGDAVQDTSAEHALEATTARALEAAAKPGDAPAFVYSGTLRDAVEFFRPTPGGNGRSCATCHRPEDQFALTPATVEARWQALQARRRNDPAADDPLFRSIDADDLAQDFTTLRTKALVRVHLPLPPNVKRGDDPHATTAPVWRAVPTVVNAGMTAPYQFDGREATLESQAASAIRAHAQLDAEPPQAMVDRIAAFQRRLHSSPRVRRVAQALSDGHEPPPADGRLSPLQARGREVFETFCTTCHGGHTMTVNGDARFLPLPSRGPKADGAQAFVAIFAGTPRPPPPGLPPPKATPLFFDGLPSADLENKPFAVTLPTGAVTNLLSSDPGRGLVNGDLREFGRFDVPTLFGIALTAPYFHDNSAKDLDAVIAHYQALFRFLEFLDVEGGFFAPEVNGQGCAPGTCGFAPIPDADVPALKAYLEQLGR